MKITYRLPGLATLALAAFLFAQPAQAQLGVAAGLNFDTFGDIEATDRQTTFENASGYHVGIFYDLAVGPLGIRPGVFFRNISDVKFDVVGVALGREPAFDLNLIEIPLDVRVRMPFPLVKPYALAAPVISFASTDDREFKDNIKDMNVSANIGVGLEIALPIGPKLFPEIRYGFGLTRFMEEEVVIGGTTIRADDAQRMNTVMLRLGIAL